MIESLQGGDSCRLQAAGTWAIGRDDPGLQVNADVGLSRDPRPLQDAGTPFAGSCFEYCLIFPGLKAREANIVEESFGNTFRINNPRVRGLLILPRVASSSSPHTEPADAGNGRLRRLPPPSAAAVISSIDLSDSFTSEVHLRRSAPSVARGP